MTAGRADSEGSALKRIVRNGGLTASADVLTKVFALVFFALIARTYGPSAFGHYVFAQALASFVWSLSALGLDRMATRDVARDRSLAAAVVVPNAAMKALAASALLLLVTTVLLLVGSDRQVVVLVVILGLASVLGQMSASAVSVFTANERMEHLFVTKVPSALTATILGIVLVLAGAPLEVAACAVLCGRVVELTWSWTLLARHYARPIWRLGVRGWPATLRAALPFGVQEVLGEVILRFGVVLLAAVAVSAVVGDYGAAYRLVEATLFIPWAVGFAVVPVYSYISTRDDGATLARLVEASMKLVVMVMAPIATVYLVCAPAIVEAVYGVPEHEGSIVVLQIIAPAAAVYGLGHLASLLVVLRRPARATFLLSGGVALVNLALCAALIPLFEARGAAVGALVTESLLAVGGLLLCRRITGPLRLGWILATPVAACVAMGLTMQPLSDRLHLALPAGAAVYVLALLALEARRLGTDIALYRRLNTLRAEATVGGGEHSALR